MTSGNGEDFAEQEEVLLKRLVSAYQEMKKAGRFELSKDLDFQVKKKIDGKKERVAKLKGNRVLVSVDAVSLPKSALKYVIAHEVAHKFTKRHTDRFWSIIENLYPNYKVGRSALEANFSPSRHYVESCENALNRSFAGN